MNLFRILVLLALCCGCFPAYAENASYLSQQCRRIYRKKVPEFLISYNFGELRYDTSKTSEELEELYKKISPDASGLGNINGLTYLSPHVVTLTQMTVEALDAENYCVFPLKIEIKTWYDPVVYIVNSLEPNSCRFNVTLRHEQTHLDLGHRSLYLFAKSLREAMPEILESVPPRVEKADSFNASSVVKVMTDDYQAQIMIYFDKFKDSLMEQNSLIDSAKNYLEESKLCTHH